MEEVCLKKMRGIFGEDQGYIVERVSGIFGSQMLRRERVKRVKKVP